MDSGCIVRLPPRFMGKGSRVVQASGGGSTISILFSTPLLTLVEIFDFLPVVI